jgi:hypothetical protein
MWWVKELVTVVAFVYFQKQRADSERVELVRNQYSFWTESYSSAPIPCACLLTPMLLFGLFHVKAALLVFRISDSQQLPSCDNIALTSPAAITRIRSIKISTF